MVKGSASFAAARMINILLLNGNSRAAILIRLDFFGPL